MILPLWSQWEPLMGRFDSVRLQLRTAEVWLVTSAGSVMMFGALNKQKGKNKSFYIQNKSQFVASLNSCLHINNFMEQNVPGPPVHLNSYSFMSNYIKTGRVEVLYYDIIKKMLFSPFVRCEGRLGINVSYICWNNCWVVNRNISLSNFFYLTKLNTKITVIISLTQ